ncbi:MAG: prolyl aminopeptidase [Betaproteobacteria bacterium]|nr:MAG: prolyl aminopeptidase [Betaproteobacteria bacterium]
MKTRPFDDAVRATRPATSSRSTAGSGTGSSGDGALFPAIEPFDSAWLEVGDGHRIHYEQCGTADGPAALFLHGGPGSGCSPRHRRLLNPAWRIVLFDQRGCGRSTPTGECRANTTADLVADIERLRGHLGITRWLVFGGSWGSSLALAYCAQHRAACRGAILRGIFLTGQADIDWFFSGAGQLLPEHRSSLAAIAPPNRRAALASWYFDTVAGADEDARIEAIRRWMDWEEALSCPGSPPSPAGSVTREAALTQVDKYRLQAHYLRRECFIGEARALDFARTMRGLPTAILHGRLDLVCRPSNAWALHQALPGSRLHFVDGAGHSPFDAPMARALVAAGDHFLAHGSFARWPVEDAA